MEIAASNRCFNGTQYVYTHASSTLGNTARLGAYIPNEIDGNAPTLIWLSGLTCTEENFITKAGAQKIASELGMIIITPDTSPRGDDVPDDPDGAYDFGLGAGFYVNATRQPWSTHYQMRTYIEDELIDLISACLPVDKNRIGISGHSMGGHGALTFALRNPGLFRSASAFAPICSPIHCPWGTKALGGYLGESQDAWREYDACALIEDGARVDGLLVDQGSDDGFLEEQLKPQLLVQACSAAGIDLNLRMQPGHDHSYYFIASFIEDHLRWHASRL